MPSRWRGAAFRKAAESVDPMPAEPSFGSWQRRAWYYPKLRPRSGRRPQGPGETRKSRRWKEEDGGGNCRPGTYEYRLRETIPVIYIVGLPVAQKQAAGRQLPI